MAFFPWTTACGHFVSGNTYVRTLVSGKKKRKNAMKIRKKTKRTDRCGFESKSRRWMIKNGYAIDTVQEEGRTNISQQTTNTQKEIKKRFTCSMRRADRQEKGRFPAKFYDQVYNASCFWESDAKARVPDVTLCQLPWTLPPNVCRNTMLRQMIETFQPTEKIARYIASQYCGKVKLETPKRTTFLEYVNNYVSWMEQEGKKDTKMMDILRKSKKEGKAKNSGDVKDAYLQSMEFWTGNHPGNASNLLCFYAMDDDIVNARRYDVLDKIDDWGQKARFAASQIVHEVVKTSSVDFHAVVLDYFGKLPLAEPILTHMLKQQKQKLLKPENDDAYENSRTYWDTGEKPGLLLCETRGNDHPLVVKFFAGLPDNGDVRARFAMSQLVGFPVGTWLDVINPDDDIGLDMSMVPGNQKKDMYTGGEMEKCLFFLVKKMLGIPTLPPESDPLQFVEDELGIDARRRCFHLGDFSAATFEQATIVLPKSQAESHHNLEYLLKENLRSTEFYFSLLRSFRRGAFEMRLAEDIVVDVRLVKHNGIARYVCGLVRESLDVSIPPHLPQQSSIIMPAEKIASWAFQVLRCFAYDGGKLEEITDLYKEHGMFCIWDLKAVTLEASEVYASEAYTRQFGPQRNIYTSFGQDGYSSMFIWKGVLKPLLQGRTPHLHRDVCDQDGNMHTYVLRYFRCKHRRFYVMVVEEKHNYNLPLHLEQERKKMDASSTILAALRWGFKVMKWFHRPSSSTTLEQLKSQYEGIFIITDLSLSDFEASLSYSDEFVQYFGDIRTFSASIRTSSNAMHVLWNVILRPIWSGRIPEIEREIECTDGVTRTFTITFYTDASKQFYTAVLVEKTLEATAMDALIGSAVEEELPTDFGTTDVRESIHNMMRLFKRYPTTVKDPEQCQQFLDEMMQVHGPESNDKMYIIYDMHVVDWLESLVYRSPKHEEYYGDYQSMMSRVKTNTMTLSNFLPRMYGLMTGRHPVDETMLLRLNDVDVDTVQVDMMTQHPRYIGMVISILSTIRYRAPKMQNWDSSQEDNWSNIFS